MNITANDAPQGGFKRIMGIAPIMIDAVNPNAAEIEKLGMKKPEKEPEYITTVDGDKRVRLDFYYHTVKDVCGIEHTSRFSIFLSPGKTSQAGNIQGIDAWGNAKWLPAAAFDANGNGIKFDAMGNRFDSSRFRKAMNGEEYLARLFRAILCTPSEFNYEQSTKAWTLKPEYANAEENYLTRNDLASIYKGDWTILRQVVKAGAAKENYVNVLVGSRTTDSGTFENVYSKNFASKGVKDVFAFFTKEINAQQSIPEGTEYKIMTLTEVAPTTPAPTDVAKIEHAGKPADPDEELPF